MWKYQEMVMTRVEVVGEGIVQKCFALSPLISPEIDAAHCWRWSIFSNRMDIFTYNVCTYINRRNYRTYSDTTAAKCELSFTHNYNSTLLIMPCIIYLIISSTD